MNLIVRGLVKGFVMKIPEALEGIKLKTVCSPFTCGDVPREPRKWHGVALTDLLRKHDFQQDERARGAIIDSLDGHWAKMPLVELMKPDTLFLVEDGEHGQTRIVFSSRVDEDGKKQLPKGWQCVKNPRHIFIVSNGEWAHKPHKHEEVGVLAGGNSHQHE